MRPHGQGITHLDPVNFAADFLLFHPIQIKPEVIRATRGDLPPEGNRIRLGHRDHPALHEGTLAIADGARLGRIGPVMSDRALGEPGGGATRRHAEGAVQGGGEGRGEGKINGHRPRHPATGGGDRQGITPQGDVGSRRQGQSCRAGTGSRNGIEGEGRRYPRGESRDAEGYRITVSGGYGRGEDRAPRAPRSNQERRGGRSQDKGLRLHQFVHPSAVRAATERSVLGVLPAKDMRPRVQRETLVGPIHLAAHGFLFHAIQIISQIIGALGGDLPPEGNRLGAGGTDLHEGVLAVTHRTGLGCVDPVMGCQALAEPGDSPPRGHDP